MERQDDKPRAYPEQEAGRRDEGVPEEGPAAADAAREYTDTGEQTRMGREPSEGSREYADTGREYTEAGRDESVEASPTTEDHPVRETASDEYAARERPAGAGDTSTATAPQGTYESAAERRSGDPAEAQSFEGPAPQPAGAQTPENEAAYEAAAERKAVTPPAGDTGPADAPAADQAGSATAGAGAQKTPGAVSVADQPAVLSPDDAQAFQVRWETIQAQFIDDPHDATEQADALVGEVMERLSRLREDYLRQLRSALGDGSDTEAMRDMSGLTWRDQAMPRWSRESAPGPLKASSRLPSTSR
jgi:hypothetical protein